MDEREILKERCNTLTNNLLDLEFDKPNGGYFVWCKLPFKSSDFLKYCEEKKIKFHIGNKFSGNGRLDNYLRLSFSFYDIDGLRVGGNRLSKLYNEYLNHEHEHKIYIYGITGKLGSKIHEHGDSYGYKAIPLERDLSNLKYQKNTVIIDVTSVEGTYKLLSVLIHENINLPLIIGTTGEFSKECNELIIQYSKNNAVFKISNFSKGIPTIMNMLENINEKEWNISLNETHHIHKKDKPSGTAKTLADKLNYDSDEIDSYRENDVFGKHQIIFDSENEQIKITHEAKNRDIFAKGCFKYVKLIKNKNSGFYDSNFENEFTKYSVCGNTFVVTDKYPINITSICNEYDVDGLIWYTTSISEYNFLWMYWNRDGSLVEMCVNGSRCIAYHYIRNNKISNNNIKFINNYNISQNMMIDNTFNSNYITVSVPSYSNYLLLDEPECYFIKVGVPHVIKELDTSFADFNSFALEYLYNKLNTKYSSSLKTKFNVSIILNKYDKIYIRTYEKGVENETGACGSACIAAVYNSNKNINNLLTKKGEILIKRINTETYISSEVNLV